MHLQNFNTSVASTSSRTSTRTSASTSTCTARRTRTSVGPSHRRRSTTVNVFVNDEALDDGDVIVADDEEEEDVTNVFSQTGLDFLGV